MPRIQDAASMKKRFSLRWRKFSLHFLTFYLNRFVRTLTLAGHDTSSGSLTWHFWELAKHPEDLKRVQEEMAALRARNPGELTANDYDSMPYFNAVMKVSGFLPLFYLSESTMDF